MVVDSDSTALNLKIYIILNDAHFTVKSLLPLPLENVFD